MEEFTTIWLKRHYSLTNHVEITQINAAIYKIFCYVVYLLCGVFRKTWPGLDSLSLMPLPVGWHHLGSKQPGLRTRRTLLNKDMVHVDKFYSTSMENQPLIARIFPS